MDTVTRIAPSPTGRMHIGTARTALFNYLWARHVGGKFIIRIEDTDPARDKPEYEADIREQLKWLGITEDMFSRQSDNKKEHEAAIRKLIDTGAAFVSKEPSKNDPEKEVEVVRFRNPGKVVTFTDELRGEISVHSGDLGDFVIARSLTEPVHHLAVVVDDASQGVTLAMRGEDLLSNTPRQILIQEALGLPRPKYLHLPLILAPDRTKLSKRRHATSIGDFRDKGYLPSALANFLGFLGWNPGDEREIFTLDEMVKVFTLEGVQASPAVFNQEKLDWINREHILRLSDAEFAAYAESFLSEGTVKALKDKNVFDKVLPLMRERIHTFGELRDTDAAGEWAYFAGIRSVDPARLVPAKGGTASETAEHLARAEELLSEISENEWGSETVKNKLMPYAEERGKGKVLWPVRFALSGKDKSPDPFTIAGIIGKDETKSAIASARTLLGS